MDIAGLLLATVYKVPAKNQQCRPRRVGTYQAINTVFVIPLACCISDLSVPNYNYILNAQFNENSLF